ncbi:MAG: phosphatidylglycerol lysyltransferase domain-containing protein [Patescibacteria group bacterium]
MIPQFPQFKSLELTDKQDVESFTSKFPPYSDFNFVSMWCWDIKGEMGLSVLNDNLVVRFTDYITSEPFYSFLGNNKVNETVEKLLSFTLEEEVSPKLCLIPDYMVDRVARDKFTIQEDLDNFDYIFDLNQIAKYAGSQFQNKRNRVGKFIKLFPNIKLEVINIKDEHIKQKILKLDEFWLNNKTQKDLNFKIKNEFLATNRFFQANFDDSFSVGIFLDDKMIGYSILSILPDNYAISHFTKADTQYPGIYDFLMRESAKILIEEQCYFVNYEQDLGLPGLRMSKKSFMSKYLRKFTVGFTN